MSLIDRGVLRTCVIVLIFSLGVYGELASVTEASTSTTEAQSGPVIEPGSGNSCNISNDDGDSYPTDIFDMDVLKQGGVLLHFVIAFYGFVTIALVCEYYFLPAVECICQDLSLPADVAAATFMSMATSTPELFVNVISTFLTDSAMGVGTTVGSATFNVLGIATCSGLAAIRAIKLRRWPIWRDSIWYTAAIIAMTLVVWDNKVEWYEALTMLLLAVSYLIFMFTHRYFARSCKSESELKLSTRSPGQRNMSIASIESAVADLKKQSTTFSNGSDSQIYRSSSEEVMNHFEGEPDSLCAVPAGVLDRIWWAVSLPIALVLIVTIPSPRRKYTRKLYPLSFLLCIVWIALSAYVVSWMLAVIGKTFSIPDAVMGITLMAAGGSMPEGISSIIMARKGVGSMGISNGLGANTLNVLMNLGTPWMIKSIMQKRAVVLKANALAYNCMALVGAVVALNLIVFLFGYKLSKRQGATTLLFYGSFITFMVLTELQIINLGDRNDEC